MSGSRKDYFQRIRVLMDSMQHPWPRLRNRLSGKNFMVLAPHFDDETIGCGGTISEHTGLGHKATVVYLTDGRAGNPNGFYPDITSVREKEAQKACGLLGVSDIRCLNQPDGKLKSSPRLCKQIEDIIIDVNPDTVMLPWFLDDNKDHMVSNIILKDVIPNIPFDFRIYSYEVWTALCPNVTVDISGVIQKKKNALEAYTSQLRYHDFVNTTLGLNQYRSVYNLNGQGFAEAFIESNKREYLDLFSLCHPEDD